MKVKKTTFDEELREKEGDFLKLTPLERLGIMCEVRERMRQPGVSYSYHGMKVHVKKRHEPI